MENKKNEYNTIERNKEIYKDLETGRILPKKDVVSHETKKVKKRESKFQQELFRFWMTFLGAAIYSLGFIVFLKPVQAYTGGVPGILQLVVNILADKNVVDVRQHLGILILIGNIPFLILAWKGVSKKFCLYTVASLLIQTLILELFPLDDYDVFHLLIGVDHTQITAVGFLYAFMGGILTGVGIGLSLKYGSSTGSFDILSQYFAFKKGLSVGLISLITNLVIAICSGFYFGWAGAMYTFIRLLVNMFAIDKVHTAYNIIQVDIITEYGDDIAYLLINTTKHGATEYHATGAYSNGPKTVVSTIVASYEMQRVIEIAKSMDENCFIIVTHIDKIYGNFRKRVLA